MFSDILFSQIVSKFIKIAKTNSRLNIMN